jgi:CelD/BcsL family acetyltransferase involved in cellulose biosynthesis
MSIQVRCCDLRDLTAADLTAWTELGQRSAHGNPFAMPQFVFPAARWLTPRQRPVVVLIERHRSGGKQLIGAGSFIRERPNLFVPVPHLSSYTTIHSFRTGLLFEPGSEEPMTHALLQLWRTGELRSHAIVFRNYLADCASLAALCSEAARFSGCWFERNRFRRPTLSIVDGKAPDAVTGKSNTADLRRRRRRLAGLGTPGFRVIHGAEPNAAAVQRHLDLEHNGWKGQQGSSLLSSANETAFFRELAERFGEIGAAVFAETLCGDEVIASDSAILLGDTLNFFKLGWHPSFAKVSPSRLNTLSMIEELPRLMPQLKRFDSQSRESEYMADLLPEHVMMVSGVLATSGFGRRTLQAARVWRPLAYRLQRD